MAPDVRAVYFILRDKPMQHCTACAGRIVFPSLRFYPFQLIALNTYSSRVKPRRSHPVLTGGDSCESMRVSKRLTICSVAMLPRPQRPGLEKAYWPRLAENCLWLKSSNHDSFCRRVGL